MASCGDELCSNIKYVLDQGLQKQQQQQQQQHDDNNNQSYYDDENTTDPEMAMTSPAPFSTDEASSAAWSSAEPETAPPATATADKSGSSGAAAATRTTTAKSGGNANNNKYANQDIAATVLMISGCQDSQTSADVSNVSSFTLPDPNGRAGGACTSALLQVLYADHQATASTMTFAQVINKMRTNLKQQQYDQIPQLSSSHPVDIFHEDFYLVPPECVTNGGRKYAVLVGINYFGQNGELTGCINDCMNMKDYISNVWGFAEQNMIILTDDDQNDGRPTKSNILSAYQKVAQQAQAGDVVFCHYSGHGARLRDDDRNEEDDGYDETLVPVDYDSAGQIRDDDLYQNLVRALPQGVHLVALMDCCHSGSVLDLPYKYKAGGGGSGGMPFLGSGAQMMMQSSSGGKMCLCVMCCCCIGVILAIILPLALLL